MIVVTGATGKLGRQAVECLLRLLPAGQVGASVRDPDKAGDLLRLGVRVRQGDFDDPDSLEAPFADAAQLLLISSNARASGRDAIAQHRNAIAAARRAGVRRIVYTSHMGASATSAFSPMHDHAATEALLAESGLRWTALRNGFYASTVPQLIGDATVSGVIAAPADGRVAWTAHADLAAAAARLLLDQGRFDGPTPALTGSESFDLAGVASLLSELTGRAVIRRVTPDDEEAGKLKGSGLTAGALDIVLGLYRAARAEEFARTDPTLGTLLGRQPIALRDLLAPATGAEPRQRHPG